MVNNRPYLVLLYLFNGGKYILLTYFWAFKAESVILQKTKQLYSPQMTNMRESWKKSRKIAQVATII